MLRANYDVELFAKEKDEWFRPFLALSRFIGLSDVRITQPLADALTFLCCVPLAFFFFKETRCCDEEELNGSRPEVCGCSFRLPTEKARYGV